MTVNRLAHIYTLSDPTTNQIRYVGKSMRPSTRLCAHVKDIAVNHKTCWIKSLVRIGLRPILDVVESVPVDEWEDAERFWISYLRFIGCPLTNIESGGCGQKIVSDSTREKLRILSTGRRMSEDAKMKLRAANTGVKYTPARRAKLMERLLNNPQTESTRAKKRASMLGRKVAPETRAKISASRMGRFKRPMSEEQKRKLSKSLTGRVISESHRASISAGHKGRKQPPEAVAAMIATKTGSKIGPQSDEHKRNISEGLKKAWAKRKRSKEVK